MTPLHLGALHGAEGFAVLVLALGPMLVAVLTVLVLRWKGERPPG